MTVRKSTPEAPATPEVKENTEAPEVKDNTEAPEAKENTEAPATPVDKANGAGKVDFAALAKAATVAPALPKATREAKENPFIAQVRESFEKDVAYALPAIPEEALVGVRTAIRRGARLAELGVSIREAKTVQGVVITYKGKKRNSRY